MNEQPGFTTGEKVIVTKQTQLSPRGDKKQNATSKISKFVIFQNKMFHFKVSITKFMWKWNFISQVPLRLVVHFLCNQRQPERTVLRGRLRDPGNTPARQGRSPLAEHQPITEEDSHENKEGQLKGTQQLTLTGNSTINSREPSNELQGTQ